jgi:DNA-binding transcriptional regulator YiaG
MTGPELKSYRLTAKFNQPQLAAIIGVTQGCISLWERERRVIPPWAELVVLRVLKPKVKVENSLHSA